MKHATLRRHLAALLLGATLGAPAAWAAEARAGRVVDRTAASTKNLVLRLWNELTALWDQEGSYIDPFGNRATEPESAETENGDLGEAGSFIDPFG